MISLRGLSNSPENLLNYRTTINFVPPIVHTSRILGTWTTGNYEVHNIYIYIYIYRERERERLQNILFSIIVN